MIKITSYIHVIIYVLISDQSLLTTYQKCFGEDCIV